METEYLPAPGESDDKGSLWPPFTPIRLTNNAGLHDDEQRWEEAGSLFPDIGKRERRIAVGRQGHASKAAAV